MEFLFEKGDYDLKKFFIVIYGIFIFTNEVYAVLWQFLVFVSEGDFIFRHSYEFSNNKKLIFEADFLYYRDFEFFMNNFALYNRFKLRLYTLPNIDTSLIL